MAENSEPWQLNFISVEERNGYLFSSGQWSDCTFAVGTEMTQLVQMPAHKLILAMGSPIFESMFYGRLGQKDEPVHIPDIGPQAFRCLLMYIYTGEANFTSVNIACEVWYGAEKYMLPGLSEKSKSFISSELCANNACVAYEQAKLLDDEKLANRCIQIISNKTVDVLHDSSFLNLELSTVTKICSLDPLNVDSEMDLFDAVDRYAVANHTSKKDIRGALQEIRFLCMTALQFVNGPVRSGLLTRTESNAVLRNIATRYSALKMPMGFSECRKRRKRHCDLYAVTATTCQRLISKSQIQEALQKGILEALKTHLLGNDEQSKVNSANSIFSICACGSACQLRMLAESEALQPYCQLMSKTGTTCRHVVESLIYLLRNVEPNPKFSIVRRLRRFGVPQFLQTLLELENSSWHRQQALLLLMYLDY